MQSHRKQNGISFPCILTWTTLLLVWFNVLCVSGERLYPGQLGWSLLFLSSVHWTSVLRFLQHNFKWTLFYPVLGRSWCFYSSCCHISNLFLFWTRSLHHDAAILCLWDKPSSLSVSLSTALICVCSFLKCAQGEEKGGEDKSFDAGLLNYV